jgi:hypothetical protein
MKIGAFRLIELIPRKREGNERSSRISPTKMQSNSKLMGMP